MTDAPAHRLPASGKGEGLLGLSQRQPPWSQQAEQAVLGALLANNRAYDRVAEILSPEHFADPINAGIYRVIAQRLDAGEMVDVVTLRPAFENSDFLAPVGGPAYLAQLLGAIVGIINAGPYARVIRDTWAKRCIIDAAEDAVNRAFAGDDDAGAIIEGLDATLSVVAQGQDTAALRHAAQVADEVVDQFTGAIERRGKLAGLTTGYLALDRKLGGLRPGRLYVLGARPSMGKTALGNGIATRAAAANARVLFVSAEMAASDVMKRTIAAVSGLPVAALDTGGQIDPGTNRFRPFDRHGEEEARVRAASARVATLPIRWDDVPAATVAGIRARARRMAREKNGGLDLMVIDYLGQLRASADARRAGNRVHEVSEIVRDCKALALELAVPVVLLSQLSRESAKREDPRPQLTDLRDSGEIEQAADVVAFLHRENYYLERNRPTRGKKQTETEYEATLAEWYQRVLATRTEAEVDVAKQRQGPIGTVRLRFEPTLTWFYDESEPVDGPAIPKPAQDD